MKKGLRGILFAALLLLCLPLCGCEHSEQEYVSVKEYNTGVQESKSGDGRVTVKSFSALKQALLEMAYAGETEGTIVFDASYEGDTTEDMGSACWQVRTQDALCAYCVENMSYELNKIVTINEATVYISYSKVSESAGAIRRLSFTTGIDDIITEALKEGTKKLVLLISRSSYSAEDMAAALTRVYREKPALVPIEPIANVNMYSGPGAQRLYEISINYGLSGDEMHERTAQLRAVDAFSGLNKEGMSQLQLAIAAGDYLLNNCRLSESGAENNAYSALVNKSANSEGVSFAYVELCRQLGLDCRIIYGQRNWQEHSWNIVRIDNSFYHTDVGAALALERDELSFLNDEQAWAAYRWDLSSYPKCSGEPVA